VALLKYWLQQLNISNRRLDNYGVWDQPQLVRAMQLGIGISSPSEYSQQSQGVSEIEDILAHMA
jgi:hypothetical protein